MSDEIAKARRMTLRQVRDGLVTDTLTPVQRLVVESAQKDVRFVIYRAMHQVSPLRFFMLAQRRLAHHGGLFAGGRQQGAIGVIRKRVRKLLKQDPNMKNPAIWAAIAASPPRRWEAIQTSRSCRLDGPKGKTVTRKTIFNYAGEERKRIRKIPD